MNLSRAPSRRDVFNDARMKILSEHGSLRTRLCETLTMEQAAAAGDATAAHDLPGQIIFCLAGLKSHIGFEESLLVPILTASGHSGEAATLMQRHLDQRTRLSRLIDRVSSQRGCPKVTAELSALVDEVFADMADEEVKLLHATI
jgi:hypothetical protein